MLETAKSAIGSFLPVLQVVWILAAVSCSEEPSYEESGSGDVSEMATRTRPEPDRENDSGKETFAQTDNDTNSTRQTSGDGSIEPSGTDSTHNNIEGFDSQTPIIPQITEVGGNGIVTTYGNVVDPDPSRGGACNYGETQILNFAAIHVNINPADGMGQWNGGRICGQCAEVEVETADGIKSTVVRIVDKCPDDFCGVDLGGAPARTLMGTQPGRYKGVWKFVACPTDQGLSDGSPALFVKEGSNPWWAIIQVRNPPAAVISISWKSRTDSGTFAYATEAENFFTVPESVRTATETVTLTITYDFGYQHTIDIIGQKLTVEGALYII